jgi:hypothetical protein
VSLRPTEPSRRSTLQELEEAILRIPTQKKPDEIRALLPFCIHALTGTGGDSRKKVPPKPRPTAELRRVQAAALEFCEAVRGLSPDAASVFSDTRSICEKVRIFGVVAGVTAGDPASIEKRDEQPATLPRIRPPVALARDAAFVFAIVSGKDPGRSNDSKVRERRGKVTAGAYGPFMNFLSDVFEARRMKASPDNCAREALALIADMEKAPPKITG